MTQEEYQRQLQGIKDALEQRGKLGCVDTDALSGAAMLADMLHRERESSRREEHENRYRNFCLDSLDHKRRGTVAFEEAMGAVTKAAQAVEEAARRAK